MTQRLTEQDAQWCERIAVAFERNDCMDWDEVEFVFKTMAQKIRHTLQQQESTT